MKMFNFFRKKIDTKNIKNFQDVIKITNFYISEKKWEEAHTLLKKALLTEQKNAELEIEKLDKKDKQFENKKDKILKNLNKHLEILNKLEIKLSTQESKYKLTPESIKKFEDAIKTIKTLIALKEFKKAKNIINEILKAEKKGLDKLLETLERGGDELTIESEKRKQLKIFSKKEKQLEKLLDKLTNLENKYLEKQEKEKFKIRFKKIKSEIEILTKTGKNHQALNILKHFLEEYSSNYQVIKFYNKEREKILKNIEIKKKKEEEKIRKNTKLEAQKLVGQTIKIEKKEKDIKKLSLFKKLKNKLNLYQQIQEKIRKKKLVDEVTLLIQENENINTELASKKLEYIHSGLTKEIKTDTIIGYDIYGKILGAAKISGDTFGLEELKNKYNFYIGDATGHGIKAGLIITLLTRLFNKYVKKKELDELALEINNGLKQDLQSRNFITAILFEINKKELDKINYVGMGHEPMLVYRKESDSVEKIIPGGLAAGIRMIKNKKQIKVKNIKLNDGDILLIYSDGTIEFKNPEGEIYGLDRLINNFKQTCQKEKKSYKIYNRLIKNIFNFRGGSSFEDDNTIMVIKRDKDSEPQSENSIFLKTLSKKENISKKELKKLVGKNKTQIQKEVEEIKKEKELNLILKNLKRLYQIGEYLKLKQECIRYIKKGWIHKDINYYLKKAIENETQYKIDLKNKKIANRYNLLEQLYKKGDYDTVIKEIEEIISKDGEI